MREPVYLVIEEVRKGDEYSVMQACASLADARKEADVFARMNPGSTYVIAPIGQSVIAQVETRWDE